MTRPNTKDSPEDGPEDGGGWQGSSPMTSFGFRPVAVAERQGLVNDVFARVAEHYDLMNDLMSGGLHRLWKNDLIGWMAPPRSKAPHSLLDVAGGTGDVALKYLGASGSGTSAVVCDISGEMLRVGRRRGRRAGWSEDRLSFALGNAEALPFPDRSFEVYTIAFGIRNVTHVDRALTEAFRVLKPGGRFLCLEFSEVQMPVLDRLYDVWSFRAIPLIGKVAAGAAEPYRYLVESIRRFPDQERFAAMIREAGFERVDYRNLTGGIAAIHSGWRL